MRMFVVEKTGIDESNRAEMGVVDLDPGRVLNLELTVGEHWRIDMESVFLRPSQMPRNRP